MGVKGEWKRAGSPRVKRAARIALRDPSPLIGQKSQTEHCTSFVKTLAGAHGAFLQFVTVSLSFNGERGLRAANPLLLPIDS